MSNVGVIFAGGVGRRMGVCDKPKQFLEYEGKSIIIHTLELFDSHPLVDGIVVVCVKDWIPVLKEQIKQFGLQKIAEVVPGGETGQDSIFNGLKAAKSLYDADSVVMIHDGVRPLINQDTITDNIRTVERYGSCITCAPTIETFVVRREDGTFQIPPRNVSFVARAPQSFRLGEIYAAHLDARKNNNHDFIDSCSMMNHYGHKLQTIMGPMENIKITTPVDFETFKAFMRIR